MVPPTTKGNSKSKLDLIIKFGVDQLTLPKSAHQRSMS